jgi:outer membrane protein assembly factor BamB
MTPAFDPRFPDNEPDSAARALSRLRSSATAAEAPLLVGVTAGEAQALVAVDLATGSERFRVRVRPRTRPEVRGDLVVTVVGTELVAFDAESGRQRFATPLPAPGYLGAAHADGALVFAVAGERFEGPERGPRIVAVDDRNGRVLWERAAPGAVGRPAAHGSLLAVPLQRQSVALLDADSGRELARLRSTDAVIEWAQLRRGALIVGNRDAFAPRADYDGTQASAPPLRLPLSGLAAEPPLRSSAFQPVPPASGVAGRVGLHAELLQEGRATRLAHDRAYLIFYRHVFAYDATGELRWARALPADTVAARVQPSGLLVADVRGDVRLLHAQSGATRLELPLGVRLQSAQLAGAPLPAGQPAPRDSAPGVRDALVRIALDRDTRMVPARVHAVRHLSQMPQPEVTRDLLRIYRQDNAPPELRSSVAEALRTRTTGTQYLVEALAERYDFLEQTRPAPLAVIVPALVEAGDSRAVPNLIARMRDHETPMAVLPTVVRAIVELGDASVVEPLSELLRLYRADSSFEGSPEALLEAARGILRHAEDGDAILAAIAGERDTLTSLGAGLTALLASRRPPPESPATVAATPEPARPRRPPRLTRQMVDDTFAQHMDELRQCVAEELRRNPKLAQVRIAFVAEADGSVHGLSFVPNTPGFADCMYPRVSGYRFPRVRQSRAVVRYVLGVRAGEQPALRPLHDDAPGAEQPWWAQARQRAADGVAATPPWWRSQQPLAPMVDPAQVQRSPQALDAWAPEREAEPATDSEPETDSEALPDWVPDTGSDTGEAPEAAPEATEDKEAQPAADAWWVPTGER